MNTVLLKTLSTKFKTVFKASPLIVFSPGRINIIGEHTDYNDGYVFPAAVDKGVYAAMTKSNTGHSTITALDIDDTVTFKIEHLPVPKEGHWQNYILGVVAELQNIGKIIPNFNIMFKGDIPPGAGMSSSAALENSIVYGLNVLFGLNLSKEDMIFISQKAEHNYVGVNCGIMDQYASMFGIENCALHLDCRHLQSQPYQINFNAHELLLINTNVKHSLCDSAYNDRRAACERISKQLKVKALRDATEYDLEGIKAKVSSEDYAKALYVVQENNRTLKAANAIENGDLSALGELMYASHEGLSKKYKVSCDELDFLVDEARKHTEVLGARMMGGGFGGCTINLVSKKHAKSFAEIAAKAYKAQFNHEVSIYFVKLSNGTQVIT
jgi:galactokinase